MVRALEARPLVAGGLREPLRVGLLAVQRPSGQHLALSQRHVAESHGMIVRVVPFADAPVGFAHLDDLEVSVFLVRLLVVPAAVVIAVVGFRRAGFLDVDDP